MATHIEDVIRTTVNGKIDGVSKKLGDYVTADELWKLRAEPVVRAFENTSWLFKVFLWVLKFLGLLGVAAGALVFFKSLIK